MARYAIDAPALVHLITDEVPVSPAHQLVAPSVIRSHALSLLFDQVQHGVGIEEAALDRLERFIEAKIELISARATSRAAQEISYKHGWTANYVAQYLAVTQLQAEALVTVDASLAAKAEHIVALAPIEALTSP